MNKFWSKVLIKEPTECWEWLSSKQQHGYGKFCTWNGVAHFWMAHRFAWILWHGEDPGLMKICHKCDNPGCVNPHHLFVGTQKDNVLDKIKKGRDHNKSKKHCPGGHEYGGSNLFLTKRGHRVCLTCRRLQDSKLKKSKRDLALLKPSPIAKLLSPRLSQ